jgi:hypothetical protein
LSAIRLPCQMDSTEHAAIRHSFAYAFEVHAQHVAVFEG